ncbi:MAG TPA: hypothetical protein VH109_05705 [Steroidobacteraceae bacterium]|jgi:hypothetical protein|nr:hypothetical protein [Steroidobacteraceae bacterium]
MLASYFTDIEQLLDDQSWDAALREACDLPRIAMALSDPQLRCSGEDVATWCRQWLRPATGEGDAGLTAHHAAVGDAHAVPTRALRRLQLRRHVRSRPRGFRREHEAGLEREAAETVATARALVAAARGWYARSGCHDPTVQVNLARLAVLR